MKKDVMNAMEIQNGTAVIGGVNMETLARECGTPLYVFDEAHLKRQMHEYTDHFKSPDFEGRIVYASKAFSCKAILKLCEKNGLYIDSVSLGELVTAKKAGVDLSKIYFHGNNKTPIELDFAFENGVGTIIADSMEEADHLIKTATKYPDKSVRILMRINPEVAAHTHAYIQTAAPDSKFGVSMHRIDEIDEAIAKIMATPNLHFAGFHGHIGSQLCETEPFEKEIRELTAFAKAWQDRTGNVVEEIDLGGGFGVWYTDEDDPDPVDHTCQTILATCQEEFEKADLHPQIVTIEPGRSLVAESGYLLYRITMIKQGVKDTFLFVDGGMSDLIRPALYEAKYSADLATKMDQEKEKVYTIAGKCCESGDIVIRDIKLPIAQEDDLLVIYSAGAYGYSMASNYNKLPMPGVVFVENGHWRWVVRPQSLDEMLEREMD